MSVTDMVLYRQALQLIQDLLLVRLKGQICDACRRRSVRCPSRGHISTIKQDRRTVRVEHYVEVAIADSVATFRSSSRFPPRIYCCFK